MSNPPTSGPQSNPYQPAPGAEQADPHQPAPSAAQPNPYQPAPGAPQGQGQYAAAVSAPTGGVAYGLGFLAYLPIPFLNLVIAGIVMWISGLSLRKYGGTAAENGRRAANWGITLLATMLVLIILQVTLVAIFAEDSRDFLPIGTPVILYFVLGIAHLVVIIMGVVKAGKRTVFANALAIPFVR